MADYDAELLDAARRLLLRRTGQRGKLPSARVRRSISTSYYALFHFLLDEIGRRIVGTRNDLRVRRRILARTITHKGARAALDKIKGPAIDQSVIGFFGQGNAPLFAQNLARTFSDAQAKRVDADYDLNKALSELDGKLLSVRVRRVVSAWRAASSPADRDFKHALCLLILLKGQVRTDV
jgi:hypothetical protein